MMLCVVSRIEVKSLHNTQQQRLMMLCLDCWIEVKSLHSA